MLVALLFSVIVGLAVGILANRSSAAEKVLLPIFDILQTLPILAFFPFVIYVVVATLPGFVGINASVIFLIFTSMVWNIGFGAYEAVRTMPKEYAEVSEVFQLTPLERLRKVLIPAAMPKVVEQAELSWAIGLFYLVTSEIFSTGSANYAVRYGIGSALAGIAAMPHFSLGAYLAGIGVFVAFVVVTKFTFFRYLERRFISRTAKHRAALLRLRPSYRLNRLAHSLGGAGKIFAKRIRAIERDEAREARRIEGMVRRGTGVILAVLVLAAVAILVAYRGLGVEEAHVLYAMAFSLGRIWLAFALTLATTVPLGIYRVFMSRREESYMTAFQVLASIPATILLPAVVVLLRGAPYAGEAVAFFIFFLSGFWYMIFSIVSTRSSLQPSWGEVRQVFQVKGKNAWRYMYLKAILPGLIPGGITAIAAEWNASIVAEYFTATGIGGTALVSVGTGLGKLLDMALASGNIQLMALGLINLTIVIILVNRLFWKRLYNRVMSVYR